MDANSKIVAGEDDEESSSEDEEEMLTGTASASGAPHSSDVSPPTDAQRPTSAPSASDSIPTKIDSADTAPKTTAAKPLQGSQDFAHAPVPASTQDVAADVGQDPSSRRPSPTPEVTSAGSANDQQRPSSTRTAAAGIASDPRRPSSRTTVGAPATVRGRAREFGRHNQRFQLSLSKFVGSLFYDTDKKLTQTVKLFESSLHVVQDIPHSISSSSRSLSALNKAAFEEEAVAASWMARLR